MNAEKENQFKDLLLSDKIDQAIEIYTGGVMPMGPDCVAMHEDCSRDGNKILVSATLTKGSNMRPPGENLARGETLISKGQMNAFQDM